MQRGQLASQLAAGTAIDCLSPLLRIKRRGGDKMKFPTQMFWRFNQLHKTPSVLLLRQISCFDEFNLLIAYEILCCFLYCAVRICVYIAFFLVYYVFFYGYLMVKTSYVYNGLTAIADVAAVYNELHLMATRPARQGQHEAAVRRKTKNNSDT